MNKLMNNETKKIIYYILFFVLFLLLIYLLFGNIEKARIYDWDEARHGINAYEMEKNNNYLVTTYNYEIDYWNLKPPLSEYFILLGYKIFGYNALGLRFYSAFAMLTCAVICSVFSYKKIGKMASIWTLIGFITCVPLLSEHCARTGDADSLFVLFSTIAIIGLLSNKENMKGFYISCFSFSLAFLTKSLHAGVIGVLIICYFLINKKKMNIKAKHIIIGFICAIMPILIWVVARYANDGINFFKEMLNYDLIKRTTSVLDNHRGDLLFYIKYIMNYMVFQISLVFICFGFSLEKEKVKDNRILITLIMSVIVPLIMYSIVKTKITWYILLVFPPIILMGAYGAQSLYNSKIVKKKVVFAVLIFISAISIYKNITKVVNIKQDTSIYGNAIFRLLERNQQYADKIVYIYTNKSDEKWDQSTALATELAGDMRCKNGGYNLWKNDYGTYLLINNNYLDEIEEEYEIINSVKMYSLLKRIY